MTAPAHAVVPRRAPNVHEQKLPATPEPTQPGWQYSHMLRGPFMVPSRQLKHMVALHWLLWLLHMHDDDVGYAVRTQYRLEPRRLGLERSRRETHREKLEQKLGWPPRCVVLSTPS